MIEFVLRWLRLAGDRFLDAPTEEKSKLTDGRVDGRVEGRVDGRVDERVDGRVDGRVEAADIGCFF